MPLQADLGQVETVTRLIDDARAALGPIDVLVNNASVFADDRARSLTVEGFRTHIDTNLLAPILLSQAFSAQADLPGGASIINLIDQRVLKPSPPFFSYGLSKAGLWHATRTLAQDLAPRIRVNAIGPGPTLKSIHQSERDFEREAKANPVAEADLARGRGGGGDLPAQRPQRDGTDDLRRFRPASGLEDRGHDGFVGPITPSSARDLSDDKPEREPQISQINTDFSECDLEP